MSQSLTAHVTFTYSTCHSHLQNMSHSLTAYVTVTYSTCHSHLQHMSQSLTAHRYVTVSSRGPVWIRYITPWHLGVVWISTVITRVFYTGVWELIGVISRGLLCVVVRVMWYPRLTHVTRLCHVMVTVVPLVFLCDLTFCKMYICSIRYCNFW